MKKRVFCIGLLFTIMLMACQLVYAENFRTGSHVEVVNCQEYITLREQPSLNSRILEKIGLGSNAAYIKDAENGFAYVDYEGTQGYVLKEYLHTVESFSTGNLINVSEEERYNINLFLSNFTEQAFAYDTSFFDVDVNPDRAINDFAFFFLWFNKGDSIEQRDFSNALNIDWGDYIIRASDESVTKVAERFFGKSAENIWDSGIDHRDGYFYRETLTPYPVWNGGFACLYDVEQFNDEYISVWFKIYAKRMDRDTANVWWSNEDCYLTLEQAEQKYGNEADNGTGFALIRTGAVDELTDRSQWTLQRYTWAQE